MMEQDIKPVTVESLSKSFGGLQAILDVNFSVRPGERLVIIGPNGAGKTTLFNLISGELLPSSGRIYLFGEDVTHMPPHRRTHLGIARTFQITNLFPNLTLQQNILLAVLGLNSLKYNLHQPMSSCSDVIAKTEELIGKFDLQENKDLLVRNLSYGIQRQIEVLMALASNAKILLLDEPTSGLPPGETSGLTSMILGLDPHMTLLIIEHDMDVAFQLAHNMIVLHHGIVIAEGPPEKIKVNPKVKEIYLGA
jgi:branched-chain amino acid transport system ATP-binding protein